SRRRPPAPRRPRGYGGRTVGTQADGMLLKPRLAHLFQIALGHYEPGGRGRGPIEGQEVRPGRVELEADREGIEHLHGSDGGVEGLRPRAAIACKAELDVLGRTGVAVVKAQARTEGKSIGEPIWALAPRLGKAGAQPAPRQGTDEGIV